MSFNYDCKVGFYFKNVVFDANLNISRGGGAVDEKPPVYSYQYNEYEGQEDDRIEFKLKCPTIKSFRYI